MCGSLCLCVFTYPSFEEVPCVVDSADSTRPPAPCTVQSQSHRLNSVEADTHTETQTHIYIFIAKKNPSKHTPPSQIYIFCRRQITRTCVCMYATTPPHADRMETEAARAERLCGITSTHQIVKRNRTLSGKLLLL